MEDQSQPSKSSQVIQKLAMGPLSSSLSSLSSSSQTLPSNQDFHFFNNFNDFKLPIDQIAKISDSLLESIGASAKTWGANKVINFPNNIESIVDDEAYDWLVDINDEIWERFDVSMADDSAGVSVSGIEGKGSSSSGVKVKQGALAIGTIGKANVPFHIPTRSEDGRRFVHPVASRVLKLERNSLEHLLQHFCGVTANKEYQNADWRLRPLSDEMLRYAREYTHYLLYIYDFMRIELLSMPKEGEHLDALLVEVYKRSFDVCMQLYEKEILTENSYLHIYGLQVSGFNAEQLAIVAGLCEWRDNIARIEDESTGYVFPNKTLLEIAKQMPVTAYKLRRLLKSKHPYVERNLDVLVSIIRQSMQNVVAFEAAAQQLKMGRTLNIILSWLYFRANAIKEDSIMPPRSLRTR
ncbi:Polynucleotidyl transferase [Hibiscus syriacus]|uniref:Polynucleotidyl transferase n=1 Tax=Hibiscus syriacus TaxID=106335 RepID=A0A6A3B6U2_HIBSY|nr:Polynucleotidyl transferase [Hibiscus syriacus]